MKETTKFIIDKFLSENFFEKVERSYKLVEDEESGKSELIWECNNENNKCISNFDKKKTDLLFFKRDKKLHLFKRVDHVVFELNEKQRWNVHLIEMKSGVDGDNWTRIKGKFRVSYLTIKAIAAILDLEIEQFYFYTTYEQVSLVNKKEDTITRKKHLGKEAIKPEDEWNGSKFGLEIGERLRFLHKPIPMVKVGGILVQKKANMRDE